MSDKENVKEQASTGVTAEAELTQDQALNLLIQAVRLATKRGAFELEETDLLLKAVKVFSPKQ